MAGRDIKSICEDAERQWAAKLLKGETEIYEVEFELYQSSLQSRLDQYKTSN
jgi:hypothetical protein